MEIYEPIFRILSLFSYLPGKKVIGSRSNELWMEIEEGWIKVTPIIDRSREKSHENEFSYTRLLEALNCKIRNF